MSGLELLHVRGLWLLLGLLPLVLLYVLKIKRQRVRVPSTWLWAAARRDLLAKHPFKRLIAELPLLLQVLALIALALALSRPAVRGGKISGNHVAIVLDTSASMGASVRAGGTRMDEAKRAAAVVVSALAPGADALIIEGGREARVASPLERDARHLKAAIERLTVREVEGDLPSAVSLAADRLRSLGGTRTIVVITDGALAREGPLAAAGMSTRLVTVGDAEDNAGIVRIDVRAGTEAVTKRDQAQVFAMVQNFSTKPRDAYVTLTVAGRAEPVASRRVLLPAGEKSPVVLTFEPRTEDQGVGLTVQLSAGDALPIDDVAFGRVPAGHKMPVTLASRAPYSWFARALEADPGVALQHLSIEQLGTVNVDPDALVVVEGACPDRTPGHDVVVLAPPPGSCMGLHVGEAVDQPQLTSWEVGDARFRFLTLDGVHVARSLDLKVDGPGASLLRAGKTTLIADASIPGRSATIVGFDVGDSDWPLKASFVLFVRNVVELARVHRAQGAAGPVRTGDPLRVAVPSGVARVRVEAPGAPDRDIEAKGGFVIVPAVDHAGLYKVRWTAPQIGSVLIAANLTSDRESDIRARPLAVETSGVIGGSASRVADSHHEWSAWFALFAAIVLAFDVWWLTRRVRAPAAGAVAKVAGGTAS